MESQKLLSRQFLQEVCPAGANAFCSAHRGDRHLFILSDMLSMPALGSRQWRFGTSGLMARAELALRAGAVAALTLDDTDWQSAAYLRA